MHRPNNRQHQSPGMGSRGGFRSPTADNNGARMSFGYGQHMSSPPNASPKDFHGGRDGNDSRSFNSFSPPAAYTPRRPNEHGGQHRNYSYNSPGYNSPRYSSPGYSSPGQRNSPGFSSPGFSSPGQRHSFSPGQQRLPYQKASPQTSSPYGPSRGREGAAGVEKYYNSNMLQDPWASLQPVAVTQSNQQSTHSGGRGRYY